MRKSSEDTPGAWFIEWPVPMLQHIRNARMNVSRGRGSSDPWRQESRQVARTRFGVGDSACRDPAPTRRPHSGSTIPKVHVWTGREPTLRSGAVGVGMDSERKTCCRLKLFGVEAGEQ